ncbi:MAG: hypothetical protein KatS3mg084_0213 [Candidatus Dojkabacteria bacterium]|nr:MAG: hypothetical protein KatS3mg084_0213 [Candidatus Dojkabacteria bacterium]
MKYLLITQLHEIAFLSSEIEKLLNYQDKKLVFHTMTPNDGKYSIDAIRDFIRKVNLTSVQTEVLNIYLIVQADLISPVSQNILLKVLEDTNKTIFMTVSNINAILPTIRSRCVEIFCRDSQGRALSFISSPEVVNIEFDELVNLDREQVINRLLEYQYLLSMHDSNYLSILALERAIKLLQSNCKVEAALLELKDKLGS